MGEKGEMGQRRREMVITVRGLPSDGWWSKIYTLLISGMSAVFTNNC